MRPEGRIESELLDVSGFSLRELLNVQDTELTLNIQRILRQVERPRANLGGTGAPGRAD